MNYIFEAPSRAEETRAVLQAAIESANDSIIITELNLDPPGPKIEYVNPAFTRMTQYSESEAIGQSPRFLQGPKTSRQLLDRLRADLQSGETFHGQSINYRKDGSEFIVEWRITPVRDHHGTPIKWLAVQRDVTDRVLAETSLRESEAHLRIANQDLEQFVYSASHDLQEPVRNVAIHAELIERQFSQSLPPQALQHFKFIRDGARRMGDLVQDLLAYTRASQADNSHEDGDVISDPAMVLREIVSDLQPAIDKSKAQLSVGSLPKVKMRNVHLRQVFQNLLTNALKYRKPDVSLIIDISVNATSGGAATISVRDNGIGISPKFHAQIFGVFRRLHDGSLPGTGMGLAITQRIVERYNQKIWLESEEGQGATFFFTVETTP